MKRVLLPGGDIRPRVRAHFSIRNLVAFAVSDRQSVRHGGVSSCVAHPSCSGWGESAGPEPRGRLLLDDSVAEGAGAVLWRPAALELWEPPTPLYGYAVHICLSSV